MKVPSVGISNCKHTGRFSSYFAFKGTTDASSDVANSMDMTSSALHASSCALMSYMII